MTDSNDMEQISATIILEVIACGKLNTAFPKLLGRYGQVCINEVSMVSSTLNSWIMIALYRLIYIFPIPED